MAWGPVTLTGPDGAAPNAYDAYGIWDVIDPSRGIVYLQGFGGDIWAFQIATGKILWVTDTALLQGSAGYNSPYGIWPLWCLWNGPEAGQNQVLYLSENHQYDPPFVHGWRQLAINTTNGQLLWSMLACTMYGEVSYDIMVQLNEYDGQIYAWGQGPSQTTVSAPQLGVTTDTPVTLTGTVMDVSAGSQQEAVAANFPNGLPCVSDASMSQFMEAAYMQQSMPNNITGVTVSLSVIDANGNQRTIGTTTTNSEGTFGFNWTPDIAGNYTVIASFAGSESYYGSSSQTYFYAGSPSTTSTVAPQAVNMQPTQMYIIGIGAAIIVVIVLVGVAIILVLRKRP